jgi:iron-sulfur cluster assembly accessory protein
METTAASPVSFTPEASSEVRRLQAQAGFDQTKHLRIGVKGGGCSGLSYILEFDQMGENDEIHDAGGLSFIMNKAHAIYLAGMQINWQGGLNSRGFTFSNPNASKTCGCGTSFAV